MVIGCVRLSVGQSVTLLPSEIHVYMVVKVFHATNIFICQKFLATILHTCTQLFSGSAFRVYSNNGAETSNKGATEFPGYHTT